MPTPPAERPRRPLQGACLRLGRGVLLVLVLAAGWVQGAEGPGRAAIASAHPLATAAGFEILDAGGNAFDAAVAVSAALAVVEPYSSGLGGGGFWLLHRASDGLEVMVDGRERAPAAAGPALYLDEHGEVVPGLSMDGALAAGIPGEAAALAHLSERFGRLPLGRALAPAVRYAREGFEVDAHYRRMAGFRLQPLARDPEAARVLLDAGAVPAPGHRIRQLALADTLETLGREGHGGFYSGEIARRLVAGVRAASGLWTLEDLAAYRVVEREPVHAQYHDMHITSAAPPSSGGVALGTMLNILAAYPLDRLSEAQRVHVIVEAMRRAYRDRAQYLGDPDFVSIPQRRLLHPWYAAGLRASIRLDRATPSAALPRAVPAAEGTDTTHFSILDRDGNRVAATLSINYPFGAAVLVPGTGVLLNDEMDDFSAKPGVPNAYGLIGAKANAIAPGKRPLSSMSPTFLERDGRVAILGTPGGSRIITMVLLGALDFAAGHGPDSWVRVPRFHHQYLPDAIQFEPGALSPGVQAGLRRMGHRLKALDAPYGNMQALLWDRHTGQVQAASDPRGAGTAELR